jgi:hypothetical protein
VLWPALLAEPLAQIATELAAAPAPPSSAPTPTPTAASSTLPLQAGLLATQLGALAGRLMSPGGWVRGARRAGAEPLWTGRRRPYDESTLRKYARQWARRGGVDVIARAVEAQVHMAVAATGQKAIAYTDMYDQVYWTKKPAHAGPIGNLGNRLLAATYFGLTFVRPDNGAVLGYHVSWHKPASPLQDGLQALHDEPRRATWLTAQVEHHIWDRGGSGVATLRWAAARNIPYVTVSRGTTHWTRYRRAPKVHTRSKLPVFVRRDPKVARSKGARAKGASPPQDEDASPEEVIFPAHPDKGQGSSKALRYRTGKPLSEATLGQLDRFYKTRWPSNENPIKALIAVGFDRNLDRGLTKTTSRGTDGELGRVQGREQALVEEMKVFEPTTLAQTMGGIRRFVGKKKRCEQQRARIAKVPQDKGARMPTGAEWLCKNMMLLMFNTLALLLIKSPLQQVQTMSLALVHELLLGRNFLACLDKQGMTLWIDPVPCSAERVLQQELVRLFNTQSLSIRGRPLLLRLRDPPGERRPLRVSG